MGPAHIECLHGFFAAYEEGSGHKLSVDTCVYVCVCVQTQIKTTTPEYGKNVYAYTHTHTLADMCIHVYR